MSYQDGLRQSDVTLDPIAALRAPTTTLLGVSEPSRAALAAIGLQSVFDLATSPLFALAYEVGEALQGRGPAALARFDTIPGGVASDDGPSRLADFAAAPLTSIRSLSAAQATALTAGLQVDNVADLGRWLPFRSARNILEAAGGLGAPAGDEASELVPKLGEFPTERRYYSTVVMDHVVAQSTVDLATAGPVDISPTVDATFGFSAPAVGARLTFEQSWYAHGVTLGNLLHSVALAPGESTRIAVVDWSRQTRAGATESIDEGETLVERHVAQPRRERGAGSGGERDPDGILARREHVDDEVGRCVARREHRSRLVRRQRVVREDEDVGGQLLDVHRLSRPRGVDEPAGRWTRRTRPRRRCATAARRS